MSRLIAIDGPDGCGKSSVAQRVCERLRARGVTVAHLREPGSTPFGERLRGALLDPTTGPLDPLAEALAFSAARRAMLLQQVLPALRDGSEVLVERCFLSTVVYQCHAPLDVASRVDECLVRELTEAVHRERLHDLIVLLDVDADVAAARARAAGTLDRIEALGRRFHARVREGFGAAAAPGSWPRRLLETRGAALVVVDASASLDAVGERVLAAIDALPAGRRS